MFIFLIKTAPCTHGLLKLTEGLYWMVWDDLRYADEDPWWVGGCRYVWKVCGAKEKQVHLMNVQVLSYLSAYLPETR